MVWILHVLIDEIDWADRSIWVLNFRCLERTNFTVTWRVVRFGSNAWLISYKVFSLFLVLDFTVTILDERCSGTRLSFLKLCDCD